MERKKILWLTSWYPNEKDAFDGDFIQRHARAAAIYHDIHVIFVTDLDMKEEKKEEWIHSTGLTEQWIYFRNNKGLFSKIGRHWSWRKLYLEAVESYIRKNGKPDCVHVHVPWKAGLIAMRLKKKFGCEFILTEHWGIYDRTVPDHFYTRSKLKQELLLGIYHQSKAFVSVSRYLARSVAAVTGRSDARIIPNVVDTTIFYPKPEKYARFTFVHVSNMDPVKNVKGILEAFSLLLTRSGDSNMQLVMVGNRNDHYVLVAHEMGLLNRQVFFRGELPYREVAAEVRMSHCAVLFSQSETFSCVAAESLCAGLPVIATNTGALPERLETGAGRLVEPADIEGLALAMLEVKEGYAAYKGNEIGLAAAAIYGYPAVSEAFNQLYREVCTAETTPG